MKARFAELILVMVVSWIQIHEAHADPDCSIGTVIANVGTYVVATPSKNFLIAPNQCLASSNGEWRAHLQLADGNFVLRYSTGTPYWDSKTAGNPGAGLLVQGDGHMVIYRAGGYGSTADGNVNGNPLAAVPNGVIPIATSSTDSYFLIVEDDGGLRLYRGSNPSQQRGLIWSAVNRNQQAYCFRLLNSAGSSIDKPITLTDSTPVLAYQRAQKLFDSDPKGAAHFSFTAGGC